MIDLIEVRSQQDWETELIMLRAVRKTDEGTEYLNFNTGLFTSLHEVVPKYMIMLPADEQLLMRMTLELLHWINTMNKTKEKEKDEHGTE